MENNSGDENSDDGLQIVIESPRPKKRSKKELDDTDKKIIESVEKDIESNLEEKAAKANLTTKHVKNIIKEVVTNEHVLALVRQAENPDDSYESLPVYEPKYTRAKTKELQLSTSTPQKILPWMPPPKSVSEVQMLFTEDLQEDSSGDEYLPDTPSKNSSFETQLDISTSTTKDEEANIALRTRSKLCLSHTPLEVIEEAFMPPDITTDMYDMDCDDDVWREFLKTFTRPLDEVTKAAEDEDHDPEYNILADEEIDEIDREELRADRAVTVSRKEFNCLMAELFEFADFYESNRLTEKNSAYHDLSIEPQQAEDKDAGSDSESDPNICIKKCQIPILAQQMRQHVQMLTQNFLLSYGHPEYAHHAEQYKDMLNDILTGSEGKEASIFYAINLPTAIKLIEDWEKLYSSQDIEVTECKRYVEKVLVESKNAKLTGREYIVTFPQLLMKTIAHSEVFIYPNLLPRIPFRSYHIAVSVRKLFTNGEDNLIALFLEQVIPVLKQDSFYLTQQKKLNMKSVCELLSRILMPDVTSRNLLRHIRNRRDPNAEENPIKFFYRTKKAPPTVHYVVPMDATDVLPPYKRSPDLLPYQWREYVYPNKMNETNCALNNNDKNSILIVSYPAQLRPAGHTNVLTPYNVKLSKRVVASRRIQPKAALPPAPTFSRSRKRNSENKRKVTKNTENIREVSIIQNVRKYLNNMLPDMPSLGTPDKTDNAKVQEKEGTENDENGDNQESNLSFKNITNHTLGFQFSKPDTVDQVKRNFQSIGEFSNVCSKEGESSTSASTEKDNPDDIHQLMIASSTVKNVTKKEPSGAEKKRAKIRREFVANLVMATPDDPETQKQKEDSFVDAYFDKLRQNLSVEDYDKLIDVLSHYDQANGEFLELFKNVQSILFPNYKELYEEFFLFLTDIQAQKIGQLMPYFVMKDMNRFMKKMHVYFKDQPTQMKKILKCLTDLSENSDVTMESIKSSVLPLFKGNAALTDWFLQIFPSERPPKLVTTGPHDIIDLSKELGRQPGEDICETVVLPDTEDPYGGPGCICTCHNVEEAQFKSRTQHCKKCGLKFMQGRIYVQTGKLLRPAVVSFLTNPEKDHFKRLNATQRKRSDTSPTKPGVSPNKENNTHEEVRHSHESEDDENKKKNQKQPKTQRKQRKVKDPDKLKVKESVKNKDTPSKTAKSDNIKLAKSSPKRQSKKRTTKKVVEHKPGSNPGQQKRPAEEPEIECPEPSEPVELKVNSEHSAESGSEFFESSQDITEDTEDSVDSPHVGTSEQAECSKDLSWSREEDKIILQAFRQSSDNEETFKRIAEMLENRKVLDIKNRFNKLMSLLQQMASK